MPGFHLHVSNRTELLLEELAEVVASPLRSPLASEVIVVQSKGMERWLTLELSNRFGIWANAQFPFPDKMVARIFEATLDGPLVGDWYSIDAMTWRILGQLSASLGHPSFEILRRYLSQEEKDLKRFQLAHRIAEVFDRYLVYRPEMLLEWEARLDSEWQAVLWRSLAKDAPTPHRAALQRSFFDQFPLSASKVQKLPERISIFGIPALPPFHVQVLQALSRSIPVHLFFMNPSLEYWGDIVSEKAMVRIRRRRNISRSTLQNQHFETGNALLASMGKLARDFFEMLVDLGEWEESGGFVDPGDDSLLHQLQSDVLHLRNRSEDGLRTLVPAEDDSLQIHSCHSPMREMEVLHDHLLGWFDRHPDLAPKDILVMTPNIESYAPFISAVFSRPGTEQNRIPYSLADRSIGADSPVLQCFFKILQLPGSRLPVTQVLDLLDSPLVQERFGLHPEDLETVRDWMEKTRVRWGIDAEDRQRHGVPAFNENSWTSGIDRLLLGYALPVCQDQLFAGLFPFDDIEGSVSQVLGGLQEFLTELFSMVRELESQRTLADWSEVLLSVVDRFMAPGIESEADLLLLRRRLAGLADVQNETEFREAVSLDTLRFYLEKQVAAHRPPTGFLSGAVTFGALLPMRSLPFRVIALVGMDHESFPRSHRPAGFDLVARSPRPGDRSPRDEDRYLFLEALLSARDYLYISYRGQSVVDNTELPPSVLVSELMEYVEKGFQASGESESLQERILTRHHLQAFHPDYFTPGSPFFSYSRENFEALQAWKKPVHTSHPFVLQPLDVPPEELKTLSIENLKRFFRSPAEYFLRNRLGIQLDRDLLADDREPFELGSLEAYHLKNELVGKKLKGSSDVEDLAIARSRGILPVGEAGNYSFQASLREAEWFLRRIQPLMRDEPLPPFDLDLEIAGFRLTGRLDGLWPSHLLRYRCGRIRAKDRLSLWIDHLLLNAATTPYLPDQSLLAGREEGYRYVSLPESRSILESLLALYWHGLSEPLHFFPEASYVYASESARGKPTDKALKAAAREWEGHMHSKVPPEISDPYYQLCFGEVDPLDDAFMTLADDVFSPLLACQQDEDA